MSEVAAAIQGSPANLLYDFFGQRNFWLYLFSYFFFFCCGSMFKVSNRHWLKIDPTPSGLSASSRVIVPSRSPQHFFFCHLDCLMWFGWTDSGGCRWPCLYWNNLLRGCSSRSQNNWENIHEKVKMPHLARFSVNAAFVIICAVQMASFFFFVCLSVLSSGNEPRFSFDVPELPLTRWQPAIMRRWQIINSPRCITVDWHGGTPIPRRPSHPSNWKFQHAYRRPLRNNHFMYGCRRKHLNGNHVAACN